MRSAPRTVTLSEGSEHMPIIDPVYTSSLGIPTADELGFGTFSSIQPFSPRAGVGYQDQLEGVVHYITRKLYPFLVSTDPQAVWDGNVDKLLAAVDTTMQNALTALAEGSIVVTDPAFLALLELPSTEARKWLDAHYGQDPLVFRASANGVVGDGVTNDADALNTLIGTATALGKSAVVEFDAGMIVTLTGKSVTIDSRFIKLRSDSAEFSGGSINFMSTSDYSTRDTQFKDLTDGISFYNVVINVGTDVGNVANVRFVNGGSRGGTKWNIGNNVWKCSWLHHNMQETNTAFTLIGNATNSAENMSFIDCMHGDGVSFDLTNGDWHFINCSIDNQSHFRVTAADVFLQDCHLEAAPNGGGGYRMFEVGATGSLTFKNTQLVINQMATPFHMAPFYVDDANLYGGISFDGCAFPLGGWITPEVTDHIPVLVAGKGRAKFKNCTVWNGQFGTPFATAYSANDLVNGDIQSGTVGWKNTGTGSVGTDTTGGRVNYGGQSLSIYCTAGQSSTVYQDMPCSPGDIVLGQVWRTFNANSGSSANTQIDFMDADSNVLSTVSFESLTASKAGGFKSFLGVAPAGAKKYRFSAYVVGGSAGCQFWIDDALMTRV